MNSELISIELLGITFLEPMTFITDLLVTLGCVLFVAQLRKKEVAPNSWIWFFGLIGASTFLGGFAHLLAHYGWTFLHTLGRSCSGLAILAAELATLQLIADEKFKRILRVIFVFQYVLFVVILLLTNSFIVVTLNSVLGLLGFVMLTHLREFRSTKAVPSGWIVAGILTAIGAACANIFKLSVHQWFTHNDVGHLFMLLSLFIMFLGVKQIAGNHTLSSR